MEHTTEDSADSNEVGDIPTAETFETHPFARATLDALPTQVAILNSEGEIVYTNRAWKEFARDNRYPEAPSMLGENYLDVCDTSSGPDATDAATGIRAVLSGARDEFSLEYPCHGPEQRRWFTMRTIRFRHDGQRFALVLHLNITERKLSELAAQRHNTQLSTVNRINVLIREIIQSMLEVETRNELETLVCEQLAKSDYYESAWVAGFNAHRGELGVRTDANASLSFLDDVEGLSVDELERTGVATAMSGARPEVVRASHRTTGAIESLALDEGYQSYAAVPIRYRDAEYGVLVVHSTTQDAFSEWERAAFEVLGETLGHASNAIENRRLLFSDFVTEVEFAVSDPTSFLTLLSARGGCDVELTGFVPLTTDAVLQYVTARGADAATVEALGEETDSVENVSIISEHDRTVRFEYAVSDTSLVALLAEHGVNVRTATATGGEVRVVAEAVADADIREIVEAVNTRFESAELVAKREVERETRTIDDYWEELTTRLTDRQLSMLQAAYHAGFFEWPRESSGEEVADSFDLSAATFHEHTRVGLEKMLSLLFERDA